MRREKAEKLPKARNVRFERVEQWLLSPKMKITGECSVLLLLCCCQKSSYDRTRTLCRTSVLSVACLSLAARHQYGSKPEFHSRSGDSSVEEASDFFVVCGQLSNATLTAHLFLSFEKSPRTCESWRTKRRQIHKTARKVDGTNANGEQSFR